MTDDVDRLEKIIIRIDGRLEALIKRMDEQAERQEKCLDDHETRIRQIEDKHTSLMGKLTALGIVCLSAVGLLVAWCSALWGRL